MLYLRSNHNQNIQLTYSSDGTGAKNADVAILVLSENPYAEWFGDDNQLQLSEENKITEQQLSTEITQVLQARIINSLLAPEAPDLPPISSGWDGRRFFGDDPGAWESHSLGQRVPFPLKDKSHPSLRWQSSVS